MDAETSVISTECSFLLKNAFSLLRSEWIWHLRVALCCFVLFSQIMFCHINYFQENANSVFKDFIFLIRYYQVVKFPKLTKTVINTLFLTLLFLYSVRYFLPLLYWFNILSFTHKPSPKKIKRDGLSVISECFVLLFLFHTWDSRLPFASTSLLQLFFSLEGAA